MRFSCTITNHKADEQEPVFNGVEKKFTQPYRMGDRNNHLNFGHNGSLPCVLGKPVKDPWYDEPDSQRGITV